MKKKFIVIALALLMVASVFADTTKTSPAGQDELPASTSTEVTLTLEKKPKYIFGITKGALVQNNISDDDPSSTTITNQGTIALERNALTFKQSGTDTYYLSFLLYEYNKVTVSMTLSGNLLHADYNSHSTDAAYSIPYQVTVAAGKDTIQTKGEGSQEFASTTLVSSADNKTWSHSYDTATTKLGEYSWASLQLTFSPVTGQTAPLKDKATGTFTSTITVTVAANS